MKRTVFDVAMQTPTETDPEQITEHRVTVILGDQLRGELEGKKLGLDTNYPIHTGALWVWAAMLRSGHYSGTFQDFKGACVDFDKVADADADPTNQAASPGSALSSPSPIPAPVSSGGSTELQTTTA